ncbi:hypothetical protein LSM04_007383 [Trypanosoma melophagium]|uniref:uncharacterized protein n=1 Tax=Trypanosoma melophagium TaxID=715481 RepID=UPI00351A6ADA|nr:hypothetical protein LSM04_007383 [Trypanosoma melophagium]
MQMYDEGQSVVDSESLTPTARSPSLSRRDSIISSSSFLSSCSFAAGAFPPRSLASSRRNSYATNMSAAAGGAWESRTTSPLPSAQQAEEQEEERHLRCGTLPMCREWTCDDVLMECNSEGRRSGSCSRCISHSASFSLAVGSGSSTSRIGNTMDTHIGNMMDNTIGTTIGCSAAGMTPLNWQMSSTAGGDSSSRGATDSPVPRYMQEYTMDHRIYTQQQKQQQEQQLLRVKALAERITGEGMASTRDMLVLSSRTLTGNSNNNNYNNTIGMTRYDEEEYMRDTSPPVRERSMAPTEIVEERARRQLRFE